MQEYFIFQTILLNITFGKAWLMYHVIEVELQKDRMGEKKLCLDDLEKWRKCYVQDGTWQDYIKFETIKILLIKLNTIIINEYFVKIKIFLK